MLLKIHGLHIFLKKENTLLLQNKKILEKIQYAVLVFNTAFNYLSFGFVTTTLCVYTAIELILKLYTFFVWVSHTKFFVYVLSCVAVGDLRGRMGNLVPPLLYLYETPSCLVKGEFCDLD